jgi:hypothetical protein
MNVWAEPPLAQKSEPQSLQSSFNDRFPLNYDKITLQMGFLEGPQGAKAAA